VECWVAIGCEKQIHNAEFASCSSMSECFITDFHNDNFITPSESTISSCLEEEHLQLCDALVTKVKAQIPAI
jgi:hypothetical protein